MEFEGSRESFPEHKLSRNELLQRARQLQWYHTLRFDGDFTTEGLFDLDDFVPFYSIPTDLSGLNCIDIGTGNGYWAFELEKRNAKSVTAADIPNYGDTDFNMLAGGEPPPPHSVEDGAYGEPFRVAASLFESKVSYKCSSIYDLTPDNPGVFDFVFCASMLMHVFGPHLALQRISKICDRMLCLITQTDIAKEGTSSAEFIGHKIPYVHYIFSPDCIVNMTRCGGFEKVLRGPTFEIYHRDTAASHTAICHTTVLGFKKAQDVGMALPDPSLCPEQDRTTEIEIVSAPRRVHRNSRFAIIARFTNTSNSTWYGEGKTHGFNLGYELEHKSLAGRKKTVTQTGDSVFPDYLHAGVSTLVNLTVTAPTKQGKIRVRPIVFQGNTPFMSNDTYAGISVD